MLPLDPVWLPLSLYSGIVYLFSAAGALQIFYKCLRRQPLAVLGGVLLTFFVTDEEPRPEFVRLV